MTARVRTSLGLLAAFLTSACATFQYGGGMQKIKIESRPPGASVLLLPDENLFETPTEIRIERRYARTLRFAKVGYCPETVYLDRVQSWATDLNFILGGLLGMWIDTRSGAAYTLIPEHVSVFLWPDDSPDRECGPANAVPRKMPLPKPEPL